MRLSQYIFALFIVLSSLSLVGSEKLLFFSPVAAKSHANVINAVAQLLLDRGHDVTMAMPGYTPLPGARLIETTNISEQVRKIFFSDLGYEFFDGISLTQKISLILTLVLKVDKLLVEICLEDPAIRNLYYQPPHTYDVIIVNEHANLCGYPLAYLQKASLVLLSPSGIFYRTHSIMGNPNLPSINPSLYMDFSDDMSFIERWLNALTYYGPQLLFHFYTSSKVDDIIREKTDLEIPSIRDVMKETRLVLMNTHPTFNYPRSLLPNMVEIGGIHCVPSNALPQDLENFIQDSSNGFIYFSLGSTTPGQTLPEQMRLQFMEAFSKLNVNVIWKFDKPELMKGVASNVKLVPWAPQQDLLGHHKIKLFITQAGLLSIQEATYHGVPVLGLPLFGDQHSNMNLIQTKGYGLQLSWDNLTMENIHESIVEIIGNKRFKENARIHSERFKDDLTGPQFKAVFWLEYIIRHEGAEFLMSSGRNISFLKYYMLDIGIFTISLFMVPLLIFLFQCFIFAKRFRKINDNDKKLKQKLQ